MAGFRWVLASCAPSSCKAYCNCGVEREQETVDVPSPLPDGTMLGEQTPTMRPSSAEIALHSRQDPDDMGRLIDDPIWHMAEESDLHRREAQVRLAEEDVLWKRAAQRAAENKITRRQQQQQPDAEPAPQREEVERRKREEAAALEASKQAAACLDRFLKDLKVCGVNEPVRRGVTSSYALIVAAEQGDEALVGLLIRAGADPLLKNSWGKTARQAAERKAGKSSAHAAISEHLRQVEERRHRAQEAADRRRRFSPSLSPGG